MKQAIYFLLLVAMLASCKTQDSTPAITPAPTQPLAMSAVINGQLWEANGIGYTAVAQVDPAYPGTAANYTVFIRGGSDAFIPLGFAAVDISLGANYLPKVGRHPINYGQGGFIGPPNKNYRQLQGYIAFRLADGQRGIAQASSGFLEITSVTPTQVIGTFELTGETFLPASTGGPSVLQVREGKFCARVIGTSDQYVPWEEEQ